LNYNHGDPSEIYDEIWNESVIIINTSSEGIGHIQKRFLRYTFGVQEATDFYDSSYDCTRKQISYSNTEGYKKED